MSNVSRTLVVDFAADSLNPYTGWRVVHHRRYGKWRWNPEEIELIVHPLQNDPREPDGEELFEALATVPVVNDNIILPLLSVPGLALPEWGGVPSELSIAMNPIYVCFWGTVWRMQNGLCVPAMAWDGVKWQWTFRMLNEGFRAATKIAVFKPNATFLSSPLPASCSTRFFFLRGALS